MNKAASAQVDSYMVDLPETSEEYEVAFFESSATYGFSATVLVHFGGTVVKFNVVVALVNLHHESGTVCLCSGGFAVDVLGAHPLSCVRFEVAFRCRFFGGLGGFFLVDGGAGLFGGIHVFSRIRRGFLCGLLWRCRRLFFGRGGGGLAWRDALVVANASVVARAHREGAAREP